MSLPVPPEGASTLGVSCFQYITADGSGYTLDHLNQLAWVLDSNGNWQTCGEGSYMGLANNILADIRTTWAIGVISSNVQPPIQDNNSFSDTVMQGFQKPAPLTIPI